MNARTLHPVALADQLGAATAHARHILTSAADHGRAVLDANPPAEWLAAQAAAIRAAILNRAARCCPHIGAAPQLLHAAAWHPGLLVCLDCLPALDPSPDDTTCDRCHLPAPLLTGSVAAFGPVLLAYALCDDCIPEPR
ncbi:hypothetical protein Daura_07400 [Dactylosporangium aurantiacum]|uniref:Uncharacterized protein n=1 Tax=Dactylosporangium aurantiacum TaxID=35754 RepID=A0A9Q9IN07_9ACTN|nr:hypothetical protein [Dactylosporangium aurantiacum]MDG6104386.1 hypothetical protein [Dactylosporangium aurantiacum]UWZ56010.1 hypothetical protein Daura_07400 [Dactylosporangium aurantiacum]